MLDKILAFGFSGSVEFPPSGRLPIQTSGRTTDRRRKMTQNSSLKCAANMDMEAGRTCLPRLVGGAICLLLCLVMAPTRAHAQLNLSTLRGNVTDSTGSIVAGAQVTLTEPATGQTVRQTKSDSNGNYDFEALKPGTYQLKCESRGFESFLVESILLESGQIRRLDARLAVAGTTEVVTVTAGAAVIATESGTISGTFDSKQNDNGPLINIYPTPYALLTTIPGVQGGGGVYPVVNGQGQAQQTQSFDGIPNDTTGEQNSNATFFQQVTAFTVNAPAESSRPVEINEVTKRGTDGIHGVATYRIYSSALDAAPFFPPKAPYLQHEWDLEVGGPLIKNRTFFYGQWFAQRIPLGFSLPESVPANAWRTGDFSSLLPTTKIFDPQTGAPFPGNIIPNNRLSLVSLALQNKYYPVAPGTGLDSSGSVNGNNVQQFPYNSDLYRGDWPDFRVDHNLTKSNTFFVRWLERRTPYVLSTNFNVPFWTRLRNHQQWAVGDTHVFSSRLVNEFRFGYGTDYIVDGQPEAGQKPTTGTDVIAAIGLQGSNPGGGAGQGAPTFNFNGSSGVTGFFNVAGGVKADNSTLTFTDSVSLQTGRHVLKFGGSMQRFKIGRGSVPDYGTINFDDSATSDANGNGGFDYASFLLGIPQGTLRSVPLGPRTQHANAYGLFAEDTLKVNPRLTLDYGVRWDYYGTPTADDRLMSNFDPATGNLVVDPSAINKVSPLYPRSATVATCAKPCTSTIVVPINIVAGQVTSIPSKHGIVPRFGAAYRLSDNFVLRGGYGIFVSRLSSGYGDANGSGFANNPNFGYFGLISPGLGGTGPFSVAENYQNNIVNGQPDFQLPNPYPATTATSIPPRVSATGFPRDVVNGLIHQFSLSVERQLGRIGLRASYIGSRSRGLNYSLNINKPQPSTNPWFRGENPFPQFVNVTETRYDGSANYNAFQVAAQRRAGSVTFNANYTYAKSTANFLDTENPYDVLSHWSNDGSTMRHYAVGTITWSLPFGHGHKFLSSSSAPIQKFVGGWSIYTISYFGSGLWYSPFFPSVDTSNTNTRGGLPDLVGDPNAVPGGKNVDQFFNYAAFAPPKPGHFGNALPFSLQSQHLNVHHLSIVKEFPITERIHFTFTSAISNIFNHPYFYPPGGNISPSSGGNILASAFGQVGVFSSLERAAPRQITFKGGFTF
jgi:hypothetical protein